jgi:hypothetical protein
VFLIAGSGRAIDLQLAVTPHRMADVLASLVADDAVAEARRALLIDAFVFVPLFTALTYTSVKVTQEWFYVVPQAVRIGGGLSWVAIAAGVFDEVENAFTATILLADQVPTAAGDLSGNVVSAIAGFAVAKWVALAMVAVYALPGILWIVWRHPLLRRILPRRLEIQDLPRPQRMGDG